MSVCVLPSAVFVASASGGVASVPVSVLAVTTCDASSGYLLSQTEFNLLTAGSIMNPDVISAQLVMFVAFMVAMSTIYGLKTVLHLLMPSHGVGHE
jgi:hypothetical protein